MLSQMLTIDQFLTIVPLPSPLYVVDSQAVSPFHPLFETRKAITYADRRKTNPLSHAIPPDTRFRQISGVWYPAAKTHTDGGGRVSTSELRHLKEFAWSVSS